MARAEELKATAKAKAIDIIALAIRQEGGPEAAKLQLSREVTIIFDYSFVVFKLVYSLVDQYVW